MRRDWERLSPCPRQKSSSQKTNTHSQEKEADPEIDSISIPQLNERVCEDKILGHAWVSGWVRQEQNTERVDGGVRLLLSCLWILLCDYVEEMSQKSSKKTRYFSSSSIPSLPGERVEPSLNPSWRI